MTHEELVGGVHSGRVSEYCPDTGQGLVRNERIFRLLGEDVHYCGSQFPNAKQVGDLITFRVVYDRDGRPQASEPLRAVDDARLSRSPTAAEGAHHASHDDCMASRRGPSPSPVGMTAKELMRVEHDGVIKEFHEDRGYGFVSNEHIYKVCGHDVFFFKGQFPVNTPGTSVRFFTELDSACRPRVRDIQELDLRIDGTNLEHPMTLEECLDSVHSGVITDFDPKLARGFVRNRRIHRLFGKDVLFHSGQFGGRGVGDIVRFGVELDLDGRPRARDPTEVLRDRTSLAAGVSSLTDSPRACSREVLEGQVEHMTMESMTMERHTGVIYQFSSARGYGFVRNPLIHRLCGRDIFIAASQVGRCKVGDEVSFMVELTHDGLPRACDVRSLNSDCAGHEPLTVETMLAREHQGTIVEYNEIRGFGFVYNRHVFRLCGKDVFFRRGDFPGRGTGDAVTFRVSLDAAGRPCVEGTAGQVDPEVPLSPAGAVAAEPLSVEVLLAGVHDGCVREYHRDKAYGFVTSRQVYALLGKDLFFRGDPREAYVPGEPVRFSVSVGRSGRLQACILPSRESLAEALPNRDDTPAATTVAAAPQPGCAQPAAPVASMSREELTEKEFCGKIVEFHPERGHGFARNDDIHRLTGHDVFLSRSQLAGLSVGDRVLIQVELRLDGRPRAKNVRQLEVRQLMAGVNKDPTLSASKPSGSLLPCNGTDCPRVTDLAAGPSLLSRAPTALKLLAPNGLAAAIIGRRGAGIAELQRTTGAFVALTARGSSYPGTDCRVLTVIAETEADLNEVLQRMIDFISGLLEGRERARVTFSSGQTHRKVKIQAILPMPALNNIIGEEGTGWSQLCDATGAIAKVEHAVQGTGPVEEQVISLMGDVSSLRAGIAWVSHRVQFSSKEPWFPQWALSGHNPANRNAADGTSIGGPCSSGKGIAMHTKAEHPEDGVVDKQANEFHVVLGCDFGPMGLRFQAGCQPEVEAIRGEVSGFWEQDHGLRVGDRLLRVNGRAIEGRNPQEVLQELARRPVLLTFTRSRQGQRSSSRKKENIGNGRGPNAGLGWIGDSWHSSDSSCEGWTGRWGKHWHAGGWSWSQWSGQESHYSQPPATWWRQPSSNGRADSSLGSSCEEPWS